MKVKVCDTHSESSGALSPRDMIGTRPSGPLYTGSPANYRGGS